MLIYVTQGYTDASGTYTAGQTVNVAESFARVAIGRGQAQLAELSPFPVSAGVQVQGSGGMAQNANAGYIYSTDTSGNVTGLVGTSGKNLGFAKGALTQIRQRDRMLMFNNGALIQAPAWTVTTAYSAGQQIRYSSTNPALMTPTSSGTSSGSLGTFSSQATFADGTLTWEFLGRTSNPNASLFQEIPAVTVTTTSPTGGAINYVIPTASANGVPLASAQFVNPWCSTPVNPFWSNVSNAFANPLFVQGGTNLGTPTGWASVASIVEFITDDPFPTIVTYFGANYNSVWNVYVGDPDGSNMTLVEENPKIPLSGTPTFYTMTWPGGRRLRRYRIEGFAGSNGNIAGIYTQTSSVIYAPPSLDGVVGLHIGDSFINTDDTIPTTGSGYQLGSNLFGLRALRYAGIRYAQACAQNGAGYVAGSTVVGANGISIPVPLLFSNNAASFSAFKPNVVVFSCGYNDASATSSAQVAAAALTSYQAARSYWPNATIIVFSSQQGSKNGAGGGTIPQTSVDAGILQAFTSFNDANSFYFPVWLDPAGAWVKGTGHIGATAGNGNADWYSGSLGVHPPGWGHEYLANRMGHLIDQALTSVGL